MVADYVVEETTVHRKLYLVRGMNSQQEAEKFFHDERYGELLEQNVDTTHKTAPVRDALKPNIPVSPVWPYGLPVGESQPYRLPHDITLLPQTWCKSTSQMSGLAQAQNEGA